MVDAPSDRECAQVRDRPLAVAVSHNELVPAVIENRQNRRRSLRDATETTRADECSADWSLAVVQFTSKTCITSTP
jgi:hypothetical protein